MRIAMVAACPFPSPQGSQVFVEQMSESLAGRGHSVHLLTYGSGREVTGRGFAHERIPRLPGDDRMRSGPSIVKPLLDVLMVRSLLSMVRRERVEVIHAHNYEAAIAAILVGARSGVPVVYHSHNLMCDELPTYFDSAVARGAAGIVGGGLDRLVPRRADHTIALCTYSAEILERNGVERERISVIPPAVDDREAWADKHAARRALQIAPGESVIGYLGNLDRYQNLESLLSAVAELSARRGDSNLTLLVATHEVDEAFSRLTRRFRVDGVTRVVHVDSFEGGKRVIEASDVVVLPRRLGSGYPIKLLNYMSAGRAVVAAGCGSKVLEDGVDGLVVADDDPLAMADALARVLSDPELANSLAANARKTFRESLTWKSVTPRIESVYAQCLDGRDLGEDVRLVCGQGQAA